MPVSDQGLRQRKAPQRNQRMLICTVEGCRASTSLSLYQMNCPKLRIAVLDSNPKSRKHLVKLLGNEADIDVVAESEINLVGIRDVEEKNRTLSWWTATTPSPMDWKPPRWLSPGSRIPELSSCPWTQEAPWRAVHVLSEHAFTCAKTAASMRSLLQSGRIISQRTVQLPRALDSLIRLTSRRSHNDPHFKKIPAEPG